MPPDKQNNNSKKVSEKLIAPIENNPKKQRRRNSAVQANQEKNKNIIIDIASVPKIEETEAIEANRIAREANRIANKSIYVNAFLAFVTVILAGAAIVQYKSSQSAAATAQKTLDETKRFDGITLKNQKEDSKKADDSAKAKYGREMALFKLQKRSIDGQIASFREQKKEFQAEHDASPDIFDISLGDFNMVNDSVTVGFCIRNLSKGNFFVYKQADTILVKYKDWGQIFIKNPAFYINQINSRNESFLVNDIYRQIEIRKKFIIEQTERKFDQQYIYYLGRVYYTSPYTKTKRVYNFIFQVIPIKDKYEWKWIYVANEDVK